MRIIYNNPNDIAPFDINRYVRSLQKYDNTITINMVENGLSELRYDPMHVSVLVRMGVLLIADDAEAKRYYNDHSEWVGGGKKFERLRRITGYLVGTLDRWNDAKKAEEKARVKHNINESANHQL